MEAKGFISDRCELNRQIKADNALLRLLQASLEKLTAAAMSTVAGIATALENARERIIVATYGIRHTETIMGKLRPGIDRRDSLKQAYDDVRKTIRSKTAERKKLQAEKKALTPIHIKRNLELAAKISGLTEEIEELRSQKRRILARAKCADDKEMKSFAEKLDQSKRDFNDLIERKTALTAERQDGITQYGDAYEQIQPGDEDAVEAERKRLRVESEARISETVSKIYGDQFDRKILDEAERKTTYDLIMDRRVEEHRKILYENSKNCHKEHDLRSER